MMKQAIDQFLISALTQGDEKAFDILFKDYFPRIKAFIMKFCKDEQAAENITQDVFMSIWIMREDLERVKNLDSYIFVVAKNATFAYLREMIKQQSVMSTDFIPDPDTPTEEDADYNELASFIDKEIEKMPEKRRQVFILSRTEGLSNEQIAQQLGISKRTVETHISCALATLREVIKVATVIYMMPL